MEFWVSNNATWFIVWPQEHLTAHTTQFIIFACLVFVPVYAQGKKYWPCLIVNKMHPDIHFLKKTYYNE